MRPSPRGPDGGTSLLELLVALFVGSLLLLVMAVLFVRTQGLYRSISGSDSALRQLRKARTALEKDLILSRPGDVRRAQVPDSLGGGGQDGEALWFLSPVDPATGEMMRKQDGRAFWQRNILYYLVVPADHDSTFGMICTGGRGPNNCDDRCPHKVLIRKVIDSGPPTVPTDEATEETLITDITAYLTRPSGYSLAAMAEPGLTEATIVAAQLLTFESLSAPAPNNIAPEVFVDLRAVSIEGARRELRVGSDSLYTGRFTQTAPFSVFLRN
ncbi:MAG: hypothetical protein HY319_18895 [Armatimonadetes bacterium]|nr:hypothetical protein [Armatimonadota bacterium]